jgi:aspartyl-tRNA(Asn)/glutamyl-tRNA(Gln) amidotransferase subunit B
MSDFFDAAVKLGAPAAEAANWLKGPTMAYLKESKVDFSETRLTPENLAALCQAVSSGKLGSTAAKSLIVDLLKSGGDVDKLIESKGLAQVSDEGPIRDMVQLVLAKSPAQLEEYKAGKVKLRQYFLGEVMKAARGKANPAVINKVLDELLPKVELDEL